MFTNDSGDCMSRWFDTIIQKVTPSTNRPIIVIDSQKYFEIAELQERLKQEDYNLIFAEPNIQVRMKYELEVKDREKTILVINGKYSLVDDMKASSFVVELKSKEIFRNFDENAVRGLNYKELCKLDNIQVFKELSFEETKKLVEEKIKNISVEDELEEANTLLQDLKKSDFDIFDEKQWFKIASVIGEAGEFSYRLKDSDLMNRFSTVVNDLNQKFQLFIESKYTSLFSRTGIKHPYTIDKVQDYISAETKKSKIAFIVIDGMNYWQWILLKHCIEKEGLSVEDKTTLSWLPSITAWARQSIFAGKKPDLSIDNSTEGDLFKNYWMEKHQKMQYQVSYEKIKPEQKLSLPSSDVTVAGFVINALDDMMHGNILGYDQLYLNTKLWIEKSGFCKSIKELHDADFGVYISTDHGNIEAELKLKLTAGQKQLMHSRSKRFIQFDTEEQAVSYIEEHKEHQLGKKDKSVYFKDINGFGTSDEKVITHGGSHILELMIPVGVIK